MFTAGNIANRFDEGDMNSYAFSTMTRLLSFLSPK